MKQSLSALLALVICFIMSINIGSLPEPESLDAPLNQFSANRAMNHITKLAVAPRPMGSKEHKAAQMYIVNIADSLGLEPEIQHVEMLNPRNSKMTWVHNVIVRIKGVKSSKAILVMAHYDTTPYTPGAADDAAGISILLELMAHYAQDIELLENDLIFLFTDGEESRSIGAKAFVNHHPYLENVGLVINLDTRGSCGRAYAYEMSDQNGKLVSALSHFEYPYASSYMYQVYEIMPNYTDFTQFKQWGIPGYNIGFIDCYQDYHRMTDTPENLSTYSLQHLGGYAFSLVDQFRNENLDEIESPNVIFFNPFGSAFVYYPQYLNLLFVALATLLLFSLIRQKFKQSAFNFISLLKAISIQWSFALLLSFLVFAIYYGVMKIHPFMDLSVPGGTANANHFFGLLILISFFAFLILRVFFLRKISGEISSIGGLLIWWLLSIVCIILLDTVTYLLVFPLIFSLMGHLISNRVNARSGSPVFVLTIFLLFPVSLFSTLIRAIFIAAGATFPLPSIVLTSLLLLLIDPLIFLLSLSIKNDFFIKKP